MRMNFTKLLAAGKSIINSGGSVKYRENKSVFLPNFGSPRNPFAKTGTPPPPTAAPLPAPAPAAGTIAGKAPVSARPVLAPRSVPWPSGLNPLAKLWGARPSSVRPVKAEQTELSLDAVRVKDNDLSDVEVEVVPLKSRPARKKGEAQNSEEWGEVGHGVFGANLV
jgi:hypothetical protein